MAKDNNILTDQNKLIEREEVVETTPDNQKSLTDFNATFLKFYSSQPFLAGIMLNFKRTLSKDVPTAGVYTDKQYRTHLLINYDFFKGLTMDQRVGVLSHEVYHFLFLHLTGYRLREGDKSFHQIKNIAFDCAVNSFIPENLMPKQCIMPGTYPEGCKDEAFGKLIQSFPKMETAEFYYGKLLDFVDQENRVGISYEGFDDHGKWEEMSPEQKEIARNIARNLAEKSSKSCERNQKWGDTPDEVKKLLQEWLKGIVNWRALLRQFFGNVRTTTRSSTLKKVNKKFPLIHPGTKRKTISRILVAVDQSGSMSDEDVQKGFGEIWNASQETEVDVINFDTEIDESSFKTWTRGKKHGWVRTRCGGTRFNAVMEYVNSPKNRGRWTAVVIYTDGYAERMGQIVGAKVVWLITEGGTVEATDSRDLVIKMEPDSKNPFSK